MKFKGGDKVTFRHWWYDDVIITGEIVGQTDREFVIRPDECYFNEPVKRNFHVSRWKLEEYIKDALRG